jgi:predicted esterase YcpF (UPF0227 family)
MIIYIHGFGGSGQGNKASLLREILHQYGYIAPSLSSVPELAIATLCELIESYQKFEPVYLIGSSLGGYYSIYLANKYKIPAALINPAVKSYKTLEMVLGYPQNFYDLSTYEWRQSHLEMLRSLEVNEPDQNLYFLLVQKGDELLDYRDALTKLPSAKQVVEEGGDHGFMGIERHVGDMLDFFNLNMFTI